MQQNATAAEPGTVGGAYSAPRDPLTGFKRAVSRRTGERGKGKEEKEKGGGRLGYVGEMEKNERDREAREEKGREVGTGPPIG